MNSPAVDMNEVNQLHRQAMDELDAAAACVLVGDVAGHAGHSRKAFELERAAADAIRDRSDMEPSRSILYRSAAALAAELGELGEAVRLAQQDCQPPPSEKDC